MASIFSPARWLRHWSRSNRQVLKGPRSRRRRVQEHLHTAVAEALESRTLLTTAHLAFDSQPVDTTAGNAIPSITVDVEDAGNDVIAGNHAIVTLAINTGPGGARKLFSVAAVNGVATFSGVALTAAGTYTLQATSFAVISANSSSFAINPAAAAKLVITQQPTNTVSAQTISAVQVSVEDRFGNVVTSDTSDVTLAIATGGGTLSGTLTEAASSGVATFSDLSIDAMGAHTLSAADNGLTGATSNSFSITAGPAHKLVITQGPTGTTAGGTISSVIVDVEDAGGNLVNTDNSAVTISIASGSGTLLGTTTVNAVNGVATFTNLSIQQAGTFTLGVADNTLNTDTSGSFNITPGSASQLAFTTQPANTVAGVTMSNVVVKVEDQFGNVVTGDTSTVNVTLSNNGVTLNGTLSQAAVAGVATFNNLSINTTGTYTLNSFDGSFATIHSNSFNITPAAAHHLTMQTPNSGTVGTLSTINVDVVDAFGNIVTGDSSSVTVTINSGAGTLLGTTSVNAVNGVATFSTLAIHQAGTFTLAANDGTLFGTSTSGFTLSPGAANQLVFTGQPTGTTAGSTLNSFQVSVEDQYGNVVTTDTSAVTVAVNGGGATISGTTTVHAVNGVATFTGLSMTKAGSFVLQASENGLNSGNANSITITPSTASQLVFTGQPTDIGAGDDLGTVTVSVEDQYGNVVTTNSDDIDFTLNGPDTAEIIMAATNGVASMSDIILTDLGQYSVTATDGEMTATSNTFNVAAGDAAQVEFTSEPGDGSVGSLGTVTAAIEDQFGNVVTTDNSAVTIAITSGSGTLLGTTTVNAVNGVATFTDLAIDTPDTYTLGLSDNGLFTLDSDPFALSVGPAAKLQVTTQPTTTVAGQTMSNVVVQVEDQFGNLVDTDTSNVTLTLNGSQNATLFGTTTQTAVGGIATFNNLSVRVAGSNWSFTASDNGFENTANSNTFTITPGAADHLAFTQEPGNNLVAGLLGNVKVSLEDQYNNILTSDSTHTVTVGVQTGTGTLFGTKTVTLVNGVATFTNLAIHTADSYTLNATTNAVGGTDISDQFSVVATNADHLQFDVQPAGAFAGATMSPVIATVRDVYGNLVTTDTSAITLSVVSGGTLLGTTTVNAVNGVGFFPGLVMDKAGTFTLLASDGGLTTATSNSFTISAGTASQVVFTTPPADTVAGQTMGEVDAALEDPFGNVVTAYNGLPITIGLDSEASLNGTTTVNAVNGVAAFTDLSMTTAGSYTLEGTIFNGDVADGFANFAITPAAPDHLAMTQEPSNGTVGNIGTVEVDVEDQFNNICSNINGSLDVGLAQETQLLGTTEVTLNNGTAVFNNLAIHEAGTYNVVGFFNGVEPVESDPFTLSPGAATQLVFSSPTSTTAGQTMNNVTVSVEDAFGNVIANDESSVTIARASGSGTINGTLTQPTTSGVATFNDLSNTTAGSFTLSATDGELSATSGSYTITPAAASKVVFTTAPSSGAVGNLGTVVAKVEDQFGNVVTSDNSDVTISYSGATLLGTTTVQAVNGVATFSDLAVHTPSSASFGLADGGLDGGNSATVTFVPGTPTTIEYVQGPSTITAGATVTPAITVRLKDQFGNICTNSSDSITLSVASGPGSFTGTMTAAVVNGVATFSNLSSTVAGSYTLHAADGGLSVNSSSFSVNPAAANKIVVTSSPSNGIAGSTFGVVAKVEDQYGNVVTSDSSNVTLTVGTGPNGATISGTATVAAVNGVATFSGLSLTKTGTYVLHAADGGLTAGNTSSFNMTVGAATKLVFIQQPSNAARVKVISPAITVAIEDAFGNIVTTSNATITLAVHTGPSGGSIIGTKSVAAVNGVATFSAVSFWIAGTYTLNATSGVLTLATSNSFIIS